MNGSRYQKGRIQSATAVRKAEAGIPAGKIPSQAAANFWILPSQKTCNAKAGSGEQDFD